MYIANAWSDDRHMWYDDPDTTDTALEMNADYDAFLPWRPRPAEQLELPLVWP